MNKAKKKRARNKFRVFFPIYFSFLLITTSVVAQQDLLLRSDSIYYSNPDSSYSLCVKAEKLALLKQDRNTVAKAQLGKARYFLLKTRYDEANEELDKAKVYFESANDLGGQARVYKLRAILYGRLNNPQAETRALKEAIRLFEEAGDYPGMINALLNFSNDAMRNNDESNATWALGELNKLESWMQPSDHYFLFQNNGTFAYFKGDYSGAISWYEQARDVAVEETMHDSYATITMLMGRSYAAASRKKEAESLLKESLRYSILHHLDFERFETLEEMVKFYHGIGEFKNAFLYQNELIALRDTLYNLERVNRINELEKNMLLTRKEKELAETNVQLTEEKLRVSDARMQIGVLWFSVFFIFIVAGLSLWMFFRTRALKNRIEFQGRELKLKHEEVSEAYRNITDSIRYAKRIQDAILPPNKLVKEFFDHSFVLYKPKDIVAGDFYWIDSVLQTNGERRVMFACCDCTGHGVPGAMVSVLGYNALNRAVREFGLEMPDLILNKVNELVEETFSNSENEVADGMDVSLCVLDEKSQKLYYAGAHNPLWIVRNGEVVEFSADNQPIGRFEHKRSFTRHTIDLNTGDTIYIFSDGFADQFGGSNGKKLKYSRFKELLLSGAGFSMAEQRQRLNVEFEKWKGDLEQLDDVCVIGVRI
jgi:serine phosphatase RsbU (regulator of sigma subunit)